MVVRKNKNKPQRRVLRIFAYSKDGEVAEVVEHVYEGDDLVQKRIIDKEQ